MTLANRRQFLGTAAAAGSLAIARSAHGQATEASRVLRLGVIGVGWYGMVDAKAALKVGGVQIVAVCDVDSEHLGKAADDLEQLQGTRPQQFKHYEQMLDKAELDAVLIGTPPHWHALQMIACLEHGLAVYCEKPLAYDIREGRAMVTAVRKHQQMVQIGFQRRQSKAFHEVAEFLKAGKAGEIVQADVQIHYHAGTKDPTPQSPPAELDWDLWCGPGPKIPYSPQVGHKSWRLEQTSGHGHLVDWGIHNMDATRMILGLDMPTQVTAAGGLYHYQGIITTPDTLTVHFQFAQLPVVWRHRLWGATEFDPSVNNGIFFYGTEATVFASDQKWVVIPKNAPAEREEHVVRSDLGTLHMENFLTCLRSGQPPRCPVEEGYKSTATVQLGMIAYESNSVIQWDAEREQIPDNAKAAALLERAYRAPYHRPPTA